MKQRQVVSVDILPGGCGWQIVCIDVEQEESQDRSLRDTVSQASEPASLAVTGGEGEAFVPGKLHNYSNHVLIRYKSQQLAGKATVPDNVISSSQIYKHGTGLLLCLEGVLDILS